MCPSLQFHIHHARKHKGKPIHGYQTQSHIPKGKQGMEVHPLAEERVSFRSTVIGHHRMLSPYALNLYETVHKHL